NAIGSCPLLTLRAPRTIASAMRADNPAVADAGCAGGVGSAADAGRGGGFWFFLSAARQPGKSPHRDGGLLVLQKIYKSIYYGLRKLRISADAVWRNLLAMARKRPIEFCQGRTMRPNVASLLNNPAVKIAVVAILLSLGVLLEQALAAADVKVPYVIV